MANPYYATVSTAGTTVYPCDYRTAPFLLNVQVFVPGGTTVSYEVDFTMDDVNFPFPPGTAGPTQQWTASATFPAGSTGTITGAFTMPVAAIRLNIASISGGPVYWKIMQSEFIGT